MLSGGSAGVVRPPFFFVLPKKNAPRPVEEKGAVSFGTAERKNGSVLKSVQVKPETLLPAALDIDSRRYPAATCRTAGINGGADL